MLRNIIIIVLLNVQLAYTQTDTALIVDSLMNKFELPKQLDSDKTYKLSIKSNLNNAKIFFDTSYVGITPLLNFEVKEGAYKIKVFNPKSLKDWQNENAVFNIYINNDTVINTNFRYYYYINSSPFDAKIFLNDSLLGLTPLRFFNDDELTGNLIFRKKNFKDYVYDLKSYDFETGTTITLQSKSTEKINDLVYKDRNTQFKTKRALLPILGLSAASIISGILAYNFKNTANKEYDKYLINGNIDNYNVSKSNDTYFAISVILMQAAVGGLIYFLFFD